jgi:hypothetical protein
MAGSGLLCLMFGDRDGQQVLKIGHSGQTREIQVEDDQHCQAFRSRPLNGSTSIPSGATKLYLPAARFDFQCLQASVIRYDRLKATTKKTTTGVSKASQKLVPTKRGGLFHK